MDRRAYFSQVLQERLAHETKLALEARHRQFAEAHGRDTNTQLLAYVCQCARQLGHTPIAGEVIGGPFIEQRFGGWRRVVAASGLPPVPRKAPPPSQRAIYKEEYQRQLQKRKEEKARRATRKTESQKLHETLAAQDQAWGEAHRNDSDEALLAYLRSRAENFDEPPARDDILGGRYLARRFGGWRKALELSGMVWGKGGEGGKRADPAEPSE